MRKTPKFRFFARQCPNCGSYNIRARWSRDNLTKALLLWGFLFPLGVADGAKLERVCKDCRHRFLQ